MRIVMLNNRVIIYIAMMCMHQLCTSLKTRIFIYTLSLKFFGATPITSLNDLEKV